MWIGGGEGGRLRDGELLRELAALSRKLEASPESVRELAFTDSVEVMEPDWDLRSVMEFAMMAVTLELSTDKSTGIMAA
jgi:hypothetical protein